MTDKGMSVGHLVSVIGDRVGFRLEKKTRKFLGAYQRGNEKALKRNQWVIWVSNECLMTDLGGLRGRLLQSIYYFFLVFGFTMVFCIPRNPHSEKMARIDQLQAGKYWHFMFGEQNGK